MSKIPKSNGPSQPSMPNNRNDSLTQEELDELYEEPFSTENALVAVMGYDPQDDKRICKYFDPKTNACFKGSNCKLEHSTKMKGRFLIPSHPHDLIFVKKYFQMVGQRIKE